MDPVTKEQRTDAIYSIPCNDCDNEYIGQTKRQFGTRLKEHQKVVFSLQKGKFSFIGAYMPNQPYNWVGYVEVLNVITFLDVIKS